MGGSAYIATRIGAPGVIEHTGTMARLRFGPCCRRSAPRPRRSSRPASSRHRRRAGRGHRRASTGRSSCSWSALERATALARSPLGVVRADPDLRWLFEQAMRETWRSRRARGVEAGRRFRREAARLRSIPCPPRCAPRCCTTSRPATGSRRRGCAAPWRAWPPRPGSTRRSTARSTPRSSRTWMDLQLKAA